MANEALFLAQFEQRLWYSWPRCLSLCRCRWQSPRKRPRTSRFSGDDSVWWLDRSTRRVAGELASRPQGPSLRRRALPIKDRLRRTPRDPAICQPGSTSPGRRLAGRPDLSPIRPLELEFTPDLAQQGGLLDRSGHGHDCKSASCYPGINLSRNASQAPRRQRPTPSIPPPARQRSRSVARTSRTGRLQAAPGLQYTPSFPTAAPGSVCHPCRSSKPAD
jgi:hypothetical protein